MANNGPKTPKSDDEEAKVPKAGTVDSATGKITFDGELQKALEEGGVDAFWQVIDERYKSANPGEE